MNEITAYECEFCNKKVYRSKSAAKRHENNCYANPKNRACRTCKHAIKDSETVYVRPQGNQRPGDADYEIDFMWCEITQKYLSHPEKPSKFEHHCSYWSEGEKLF